MLAWFFLYLGSLSNECRRITGALYHGVLSKKMYMKRNLLLVFFVPLIAIASCSFTNRSFESDDKDKLLALPYGEKAMSYITIEPEGGNTSPTVQNIVANIKYFIERMRDHSKPGRSETGMVIAHLGVGLFLIGASLTNAVSTEKHRRMEAGDRYEMSSYTFEFLGTRVVQGPNYLADEGGVRREVMRVSGRGEAEPMADNNTDEGRRLNRRVVIEVIKQ